MYEVGDIVFTRTLDEILEQPMDQYESDLKSADNFDGFRADDLEYLHDLPLIITKRYGYPSFAEYYVERVDGVEIDRIISGFRYMEIMFYPDCMTEAEYYGSADEPISLEDGDFEAFFGGF